jgi:hypothetical protein
MPGPKQLLFEILERARRIQPPAVKDGYAWTPYMRWLNYATAGMMTYGNVSCWRYAILNAPRALPVVEIGAFCGLSTNFMAYFIRKYRPDLPLFCCDRWIFEGETGSPNDPLADGTEITVGRYREFVKASFIRNCQFFSHRTLPHAVELFSIEFFDAWRDGQTITDVFNRDVKLGGPIGFAFIDGDHSYQAAKADFEACDQVLVPGGFLLFDDSRDFSDWPPNRVAREVLRDGKYDLVARNPNYLLRKK